MTSVALSAPSLNPNQPGQVIVTVSNIPSGGLSGYDLTIAYNKDVVTVTSVAGGDGAFASAPATNINNSAGTVNFSKAIAPGSTSGSVIVARLNVLAATNSEGATTSLTLTINSLVNNATAEINPRAANSGSVSITNLPLTPAPAPTPPTPPSQPVVQAVPAASGWGLLLAAASIMVALGLMAGRPKRKPGL